MDNSILRQKIALRLAALQGLQDPQVLEAYGGIGRLWMACYSQFPRGVVFEKDRVKSSLLARQRPGWAVYQTDCEKALSLNAGAHLPINFVDFEAWGSPYDAIRAFFHSERPFPEELRLVATDGSRLNLKLRGFQKDEFLSQSGVDAYENYLHLCQGFLVQEGAARGYELCGFRGGYCGHAKQMTLYSATFRHGNS